MSLERHTIDSNILSVKETTIPPATEYSESGDWVKYRPNTDASNFGTAYNQTLDIFIPKQPDVLIDFKRSYYNLDFYVQLLNPAGAAVPFLTNDSFTPVENFLDTLFSNISTSGMIDSTPFWNVDNSASAYVSGQYRLLKTHKKVVGGENITLTDLNFANHVTSNVPVFDEVEDPLHLSIPESFSNPDIWTNIITGYDLDSQTKGLVQNRNAAYRSQYMLQLRSTSDYGNTASGGNQQPNRNFQVCYHPYHPLFWIERKMPLVSDLTVTLRRAPSFAVSYQGSPTGDAAVGTGSSYRIVFKNIEFWASLSKPRSSVMALLNEIKLSNKLEYAISRVYSNVYPVVSTNFQQNINVGAGDLLLVCTIRNQQFQGITDQDQPADLGFPGDKLVPVMATAPRSAGFIPDVLYGTAGDKYPHPSTQLVTLPVQYIYVTDAGKQIPQNQPYNPDAPLNQQFNGSSGGNMEISAYDRAYYIFAEQLELAGYGHVLKNVTKNNWQTYLRIYAFFIGGGDYAPIGKFGTLLTLRKQVNLNIQYYVAPSFGEPNINNTFSVISVAYSNQALIHINPDNTTQNYF
jgi:hypothetical protein